MLLAMRAEEPWSQVLLRSPNKHLGYPHLHLPRLRWQKLHQDRHLGVTPDTSALMAPQGTGHEAMLSLWWM